MGAVMLAPNNVVATASNLIVLSLYFPQGRKGWTIVLAIQQLACIGVLYCASHLVLDTSIYLISGYAQYMIGSMRFIDLLRKKIPS